MNLDHMKLTQKRYNRKIYVKENTERKTFRDRGEKDYEQYLIEENVEVQMPYSDTKNIGIGNNNQHFCQVVKDTNVIQEHKVCSPLHFVTQGFVCDNCQVANNNSDVQKSKKYPPLHVITKDFVTHGTRNSVDYILNIDGTCFRFVDVPGNGYYFHSCLKYSYVSERFDSV